MKGNTSDRTTLWRFLTHMERAYGKARRVWVMDRGIPTEALLAEMRQPERQTYNLVGTPKSKIDQHEQQWLDLPWQQVRDSVEVKLYAHEGELAQLFSWCLYTDYLETHFLESLLWAASNRALHSNSRIPPITSVCRNGVRRATSSARISICCQPWLCR